MLQQDLDSGSTMADESEVSDEDEVMPEEEEGSLRSLNLLKPAVLRLDKRGREELNRRTLRHKKRCWRCCLAITMIINPSTVSHYPLPSSLTFEMST